MQYRKFGNTDLETSVIGLGGWPMGGRQYGAIEENEVIQTVHKAIDLGVTLFDTAQQYGWGAGEELLGRALKGKRNNCVLATKTGQRWDPDNVTKVWFDSSKEFLNSMLEGSLKRLQTDYIDLFLIHWPDESRPFSEPMEVFSKWKKEGKIRYGGVSNFSVAQMEESLQTFPIVCDQVGYNLFDRRPEEEILPFCREQGLGVMTYGSLCFGLLTGTMTADTKFDEGDWRRWLQDPDFKHVMVPYPLFAGERFVRNLEIVEKLKRIAASQDKTVAQLAAAWVISNPAVTVALTGVRKPSEIEDNAVAGDWNLTDEIKAEIEQAFTG